MSQPKREQLLFVLRQTELARDIMAFAIDRQARGLSPRTCEYYSEELRHPLVYLDGRVVQGVHDTTTDPVRGCVLHLSDLGRNSEGRSLAQAEFWERRLSAVQRRYLRACETLTRIRRLALPAMQVNIGEQQVNVAKG